MNKYRLCWLCGLWLGMFGSLLHAQSSAPTHLADGEWVTDWLVLDRYLASGEQTNFLAEFPTKKGGFPDEKDVWLDASGMPSAWRRVLMRGARFNVRTAVGKDYAGKSAFLFCRLAAEGPGDAEIRLSSWLDATLWLNGQELQRSRDFYDARTQGATTRIFQGQIQAGTNSLLVRVSQLGLDHAFGLRILPPKRTLLTGRVFDLAGKAILKDVTIAAFQGGNELERIGIDGSGCYHLSLTPTSGEPCDIAFTSGDQGRWWLGQTLRPGERLTRDVTLHPAVSLSGTLSMLDQEKSPHCEVTVQALREGVAAASVLTDEKGHYQFVNLKPGDYRVRCQTPSGYRDCLASAASTQRASGERDSPTIRVEENKTVRNLDARFAAFKKGVWKRYDTLDGVPNNVVLSIVRAPSGELWLQTGGGLGVFDGQRFATIAGTQGKPITALALATNGSVWFGTYSGLYRLEGGSQTRFEVTNGLPDDAITCLCAAHSGEIWIGTGYGLSVYDGRRFRSFTTADGLAQDDITALAQAPDGAIWVGTTGGVSRYDGRRFASFSVAEGLSGNQVTALDCSSVEHIRVATQDGLATWNGHGFTPLYSWAEQVPRRIGAVYAAADGRLWLGTEYGLAVFDGHNMINVRPEEGLGSRNVSSIVSTPEGLLWFATDNGVACLDLSIVNYTTKDGLADNRMFDLCLGPGNLWLGMQWGGLGRFDFATREFTTVLPDLYVRKLHRTADGVLWVGSNKGVFRYDGSRTEPGELLGDRWIMAISSDAEGGLWFGDGWSGGGLVRAQTNAQGTFAFRTMTREDGLAHNQVNGILCLPTGITWLATSGGASRFDGRHFQNFTSKDGLPDDTVRALCQGRDGAIWLGTYNGVARYDGHSFSNITAAYGLPPSRIWSIFQSRDGLMWFGTATHGVCVFDGRAFATLDTRDGLAENSVLAIAEDGEENLWFATAKGGLTCYRRKRKDSLPKVRLTQVKAGGKVLPYAGRPPRLRAGEVTTFGYEGLDWLTPPDKRQYRICLRRTGASTPKAQGTLDVLTRRTEFDWTPEFTGSYTLDVQSIDLNLAYSEPVHLAFSVFVPWYESNPWRISGGLAAAALLLSAYWLAYSNLAQRREARRLKDLMLVQERVARAAIEDKHRQLEQRATELQENQRRLQEALANVRTLRGLVPICAWCKKIRDDNGFWEQVESFVQKHSEAKFSHGMCPDCMKKWEADLLREAAEDNQPPTA